MTKLALPLIDVAESEAVSVRRVRRRVRACALDLE